MREVLHQKEKFLQQVEEQDVPGVTREKVSKLIEEFKLYEYSVGAAEILLGLRKAVKLT